MRLSVPRHVATGGREASGRKLRREGRALKREIPYSNVVPFPVFFFFWVGIVFSGGIAEMACSQRPILAALGEKLEEWKEKKREREGRIEEKEREGERGRDEGEQRTRNRPEKTPSNGPIESSN